MVQMRRHLHLKVWLAPVKYQENEQFQLQNFVLELLFRFKKILDGRTVHSCNLPLVWNCRSRKRYVTFLSYRLWFEKIRFLVPRIICTWQAWFVPVICGGNHSFALRAVQSAPCWAASRMPGVHPSAERLSRDNALSKYSEEHYGFFQEQTLKSSVVLTGKTMVWKENKQNGESKTLIPPPFILSMLL